jgi:hypothetical protein
MLIGQATQVLVPGYMYESAGHTHALSNVEPAGDTVPAGQLIAVPPSQYLFVAHLQSVMVVALVSAVGWKLPGHVTGLEPGAANPKFPLTAWHCKALVAPGIAVKLVLMQAVHVPGADKYAELEQMHALALVEPTGEMWLAGHWLQVPVPPAPQ